jgi:hypothetical protein
MVVGKQRGFLKMWTGGVEGENPGEQVMLFGSPDKPPVIQVRLRPKRPYRLHHQFLDLFRTKEVRADPELAIIVISTFVGKRFERTSAIMNQIHCAVYNRDNR